jgi:hypothetical protein
MNEHKNPPWWTPEMDAVWEHTKEAFRRGWDRTKPAGTKATANQNQPVFEELEPYYRFGYGARGYYSHEYSEWTSALEKQLQNDWLALHPERADQWKSDLRAIRYGWEYNGVILEPETDEVEQRDESEMMDFRSMDSRSGKM